MLYKSKNFIKGVDVVEDVGAVKTVVKDVDVKEVDVKRDVQNVEAVETVVVDLGAEEVDVVAEIDKLKCIN